MRRLLGERPTFDWKIVVVTVVSTLLLLVDAYHPLTAWKYLDRVILYLVIPLAITTLLFREHPRGYGFTFGDWRAGLALTVGAITIMAPVIWLLGRESGAMQEYYEGLAAGLPWTTFLDLIGWEFFFRGWILFAYARRFGAEALWLQAVPFTLAHAGKPELEVLSTIFGGFAFGWLAYRTRSFVWPFLVHWFVATLVIVAALSAGA